jgi:signal transduction histidine kinase
MKRLTVLLIWTVSTTCLLWGQSVNSQSNVDSLEHVLTTKAPTGDELQKLYGALSWGYLYTDRDKSMDYSRKRVAVAESLNARLAVADGYFILGSQHWIVSQHDSAIVYFNKGLQATERAKDFPKENTEKDIDEILIKLYCGMANTYMTQGDANTAIDYNLKALKLAEKHQLNVKISIVHYNTGILYQSVKNYEEAEDHYRKSLEFAGKAGDSLNMARSRQGLTAIYSFQKKYDMALEEADNACRYYSSHAEQHASSYVETLSALAQIYLDGFNDDRKAETCIRQALILADKTQLSRTKASMQYVLSEIYIYRKEWRKAEQTALLALATDSAYLQFNIDVYRLLVHIYAHLGDAERTVDYFVRAFDLEVEYSNKNYQSALSEMEVKYETEKKELQIAEQETVIARQKTVRTALFSGLALLAVILALLWYLLRLRNLRNRELDERNRILDERNCILDEMNATKDRFFNIISHDLRNPAIAQCNALETLLNYSNAWDADKLKMFYSQLLDSANSEVELLNNLLNWARVQTNRMPYQPDTFELATALTNEITLIRNMAANKGITLDVRIPDGALVTADSNMLSTILRNLLTNAVKFTAAGGKVSLVGETSGDRWIITVSDTGQGMTSEQISDLFRIDKRIATGTSGEQGTGVGLIVCKELLEKHGSTLNVESEEGKGSRFWFRM